MMIILLAATMTVTMLIATAFALLADLDQRELAVEKNNRRLRPFIN